MYRKPTSWAGRLALVLALSAAMIVPVLAFAAVTSEPVSQTIQAQVQEPMVALASPAIGASVSAQAAPTVWEIASTTYVYRTRTGTKYHRHSCIAHHTHWRVTLHVAKYHYHLSACKVCRPPR